MVQRKKKNIRIGPVGLAILGIVATTGTVTLVAVFPGVALALAPFLKKKKYSKRQITQRNIDSLIKHGLLEEVKKNGKIHSLKITRKGRWEAGIRGYFDKEYNSQKVAKWDSLWRIIIFDVPENKRKLRGELRHAVRKYGFKQLQQSVWIYPYPCNDFVELVKSHLGVSNDVLYLTVQYLENDKWLKRDFKL